MRSVWRCWLSLLAAMILAGACATAMPTATPTPVPPTAMPAPVGAFTSGQYHDLFRELLGKSDAEVQAKLDAAWKQLFYGDDKIERVYYPVGPDMAYIEDIGNSDVRTEGMSYGMMIAVQLNKKDEFDRLWKWAKTYMYQPAGENKGYFAWHCNSTGKKLDNGPAPDGEEWFATALYFASARWGNGDGIFNYQAEAQAILHTMLHKDDEKTFVFNMFNRDHKMVVFVPSGSGQRFTDPSYHLPAYYEIWARRASEDNQFWAEAAQASRAFFRQAANPQTGLMPDYANFDGSAYTASSDHKDFRFDAFRIGSNVAVDYAWFAADPSEVEQSNRLLQFFAGQGITAYGNQYSLDGKPLSKDHSPGLVAMNAVAALAATTDQRQAFVQDLWNQSIPSGQWRYYDGMLYLLGLLHVSGNFRIYMP
jgi:oligosaccharide reducing-end xylanase